MSSSRPANANGYQPQLLSSAALTLRRLVLVLAITLAMQELYIGVSGKLDLQNLGLPMLAVVMLLCYRQLKAGQVNRGLITLCWGIFLCACINGVLVSGIRTPILFVVPVLLMTTAWIQGRRAAWAMAVCALAHLVFLAVAEHRGWLPQPIRHTSFELLLAFAPITAMAAILGVALANAMRGHLEREQALSQDLRELNETLESRIRTRTQELGRAKETAESANRAKSVFLANMSHELRTPLNAILGFARLLARDAEIGAENRKKLATINRAGQHLLALINDVLAISRIEAGSAVTKPAAFGLGEVLGEMAEMMRQRADEKGLSFSVERERDLPDFVMGDAHHLKQILINLLGNAVKYTDRGQVALRVRAAGGEIRFEVADTGAGISRADQEKIFKAFYQTEGGIAKGEGTGLGLTISEEYARLMGGELTVASEPGQGSVFCLKVPLPATAAPQDNEREPRGRVAGLAPGTAAPRILVTDDKGDNRELVSQLLAAVGFEVRTAEDGQQAIEAYLDWQPALILMDIRMPVLDGYEATRRIRQLPGGAAVKIVALTASAFEEDRTTILAAGCDEMVAKPIEEERLLALLGDLLGLAYRYVEAPPAPPSPLRADLDLSLLPPELLAKLRAAAERLELNSVRQIVTRIGEEHDRALAAELGELLARYRFDRIVAACELAAAAAPARR